MDKLSHYHFLKLMLASIGAFVFLGACAPKPSQLLTPTITPTITETSSPQPTATNSVTPTFTITETLTVTETLTEIPCFHLLEPENGATFGTRGRISFQWSSQVGASLYKLLITLPNGELEEYQNKSTLLEKYLESLPIGGEYTWQVIALKTKSVEICSSEIASFSKGTFEETRNNEKNKNTK
jgi:hypothetical protein